METKPFNMQMFKNIFDVIDATTNINFENLVKHRKALLIKEGYNVESVNWDLYAKVLEAKFQKLKSS